VWQQSDEVYDKEQYLVKETRYRNSSGVRTPGHIVEDKFCPVPRLKVTDREHK